MEFLRGKFKNQWLPMTNCGLIVVEIKADNDLAIGLPVYFKSIKK